MLVNGRISSRSYPRYRLARPFFRRVLANVDRFCMQGEESARRIVDIGAEPDRVVVTGSLKFDSLELPAGRRYRARPQSRAALFPHRQRPPGADRGVHAQRRRGSRSSRCSSAIRARVPDTLLIVAPRKPERFGEVEQLARRGGWNVARRTELRVDAEPRHDVVVLDVIGELAQLYQIATAVFVGGSLVDQGGHNIIEPAVFGKADRVRPAHAELRRDRARVPGERGRASRSARRASSSTRCSGC